jgi:myosin heavy subunit
LKEHDVKSTLEKYRGKEFDLFFKLARKYKCPDPLKEWKEIHLTAPATVIQRSFRGFLARTHLFDAQAAATTIQRLVRGFSARAHFSDAQAAITTIQCLVRGFSARKLLSNAQAAATVIQHRTRGFLARNHFRTYLDKKTATGTKKKAAPTAKKATKSKIICAPKKGTTTTEKTTTASAGESNPSFETHRVESFAPAQVNQPVPRRRRQNTRAQGEPRRSSRLAEMANN